MGTEARRPLYICASDNGDSESVFSSEKDTADSLVRAVGDVEKSTVFIVESLEVKLLPRFRVNGCMSVSCNTYVVHMNTI